MNLLIYKKQQKSKCITTSVNKQNYFFLDDGIFFHYQQSTVPSKPHFSAGQFQSAEMTCSLRRNCSVSLQRSSMFFASHGEQSSTCPLALKPLKHCYSFLSHFSNNDDDGEDFICFSRRFRLFCQSTLLVAVLHWPCCLRLITLLCKQECTRKKQ